MLKRMFQYTAPRLSRRTRRALPAGFVGMLGLVLFATGCEQSTGMSSEAGPVEVAIVTLQAQPVELFDELNGRTSAYRVAEVRPQINGIIQKRLFEEGSQVKAGQTLYQIDPKPYRAEVERAGAELAKARAAVRAIELRTQRFEQLLENSAVSKQEYDDALSNLEQSKAQVQVAAAALQAARINLDYTTVKSPIDGNIGRSFVTEGALVTANQSQALAQVTQLDPIYVDISRSSDELLRLKKALAEGNLKDAAPDQAPVTLLLENSQQYPLAGQLQFSDVTVDQGTGTVTLRALFPNPDHDLLPGMFVRARLSEGVKQNALLVPQQGVTHNRQGQATALVVNSEGKVEKRRLEAPRTIGSFWLVTAGLQAGDQLIVTGLQHVQPGDPVITVPADIPNHPQADNHG